MSATLWQSINYTTDMPYIIAHNIYEYDIRKANINVLYALGIIDKNYYDRLNSMEKLEREKDIGYLIKYNPKVYDNLSKGIKDYKRLFMTNNLIDDMDILSIKNDAVFLIDKIPKTTRFGNVEFVMRNTYTSYIRLKKLEIYFTYDAVSQEIILDIKGISEEKLLLHEDFLLNFIAQVLKYVDSGDVNSALTHFTAFFNMYIGRSLNIGFYRMFDADSQFMIPINHSYYRINKCDNDYIYGVDISYNLTILRELYGILTSIYFQSPRRGSI